MTYADLGLRKNVTFKWFLLPSLAGLFEIAGNGVQSVPFEIRFLQSCFCALELRVFERLRYCVAAWSCGPVPAPVSPLPPSAPAAK